MDEIKIGPVLKRVLKKRRLSLQKVSRETGIPYSTLHSWRENRQPKDIVKLRKLATFLNMDIQALVFDSQEHSKDSPSDLSNIHLTSDLFKGFFEIIIRKIK